MLDVRVTDAPLEGVEAVLVQFSALDVHKLPDPDNPNDPCVANPTLPGCWIRISETPTDIDLFRLRGGVTERLGLEALAPGRYTQVRIFVESVVVVVNGKPEQVEMPNPEGPDCPLIIRPMCGLKLVHPFEVAVGKVTVLTLDFDLERSLHFAPGKGWTMRPTIKVLSTTVEPVTRLPPDQLAALEALQAASSGPVEVRFNDLLRVPEFLSGDWAGTDPEPHVNAVKFLEQHAAVYRMDPATDSFGLLGVRANASVPGNLTSVKLQQLYRGLPVFGAEQVVQMLRGRVVSVHGKFVPRIDASTAPGVSAKDALDIAVADFMARFPGVGNLSFTLPVLGMFVFNYCAKVPIDPCPPDPWTGPIIDFNYCARVPIDPCPPEPLGEVLVWRFALGPRPTPDPEPPWDWQYTVNADTGGIELRWEDAQDFHPSWVWDAAPSPDVLWFVNHMCLYPICVPPADVDHLNTFGDNYYLYLQSVFGINSIDNAGLPLVGRARHPGVSNNARWVSSADEAIFGLGMATQDIVAHEYTHGLVAKLAGGLQYLGQSGALNEANADIVAEYLECQTGCNWLMGQDSFGNVAATGVFRSLANPPLYGQPDHMDNYVVTSSDFGGVHTNSGIPNKVGYLIKQGGTHYGIAVTGMGVGNTKADRLVFSTLVDAGLTSTATFSEYRDVMLQTCRILAGAGVAGITSSDCRQVFRAWCSVGICAISQVVGGTVNENYDRFGFSLARGNFNGDSYEDLAVGVRLEDSGWAINNGMVVVFYGSSGGLTAENAELLSQSHAGLANEDGDQFGYALGAGDFNADGFDDLAVGVPHEDIGGLVNTGMVVVFRGSVAGLLVGRMAAGTEVLTRADTGEPGASYDYFGHTLVSGKFRGDTIDDLVVGAPWVDPSGVAPNGGAAIMFFGSSGGLLAGSPPFPWEFSSGGRGGYALAVGDFNADGFEDLAVGAPYGESFKVGGFVIILLRPEPGGWFGGYTTMWEARYGVAPATGDRFGWSLAAGDYNGDGVDDLAIGAPFANPGGTMNAGLVIAAHGPDWPTPDGDVVYHVSAGVPTAGVSDLFGFSLTSGDFNGDARDDLAVGVPFANHGAMDDGAVDLFYGGPDGITTGVSFDQASMGGQDEVCDHLGWALASGDFDGNGLDDLAVSAPDEDFPGGILDAGAVYVKEF